MTVWPSRTSTSRLVRASPSHVGGLPTRKTDDVEAALHQRARDDESVTAVVAAAAQHDDLPRSQIGEHRLHRRHHLAAGILHEDDRRDADVAGAPAVGFAHLGAVENPHAFRSSVLLVLDCGQSAISYQLSAISYQLSAISYQLSAISYQLPAGMRNKK